MAQPSAGGSQQPEPAPPADSASSKTAILNAYGNELKNLAKELQNIEEQKAKIRNEINRLNFTDPSPVPDVVPTHVQIIAFIKALEKADELFKFKDHLKRNVRYIKHNSDGIKCFKSLVTHNRVQDIFKLLDFQDILDAVKERILSLQFEKDSELKLAINKFSKDSEENKKPFTLIHYEEHSGGPVLNAIVKLLYQVREKGYVMNKDPSVELDLLKKHNPYFYKHFIRGLREKFSEKTVKVYNVPVAYGEREVKELFRACGRIESVKFDEFEGYSSKFAYVTFKTSEAAKLAPVLMCESLFWVEPLPESPEWRSYSESELIQARHMYETFQDPRRSSKESSSSSNGK